jgi:hypothetical protein
MDVIGGNWTNIALLKIAFSLSLRLLPGIYPSPAPSSYMSRHPDPRQPKFLGVTDPNICSRNRYSAQRQARHHIHPNRCLYRQDLNVPRIHRVRELNESRRENRLRPRNQYDVTTKRCDNLNLPQEDLLGCR